jgi:O-antigen/teichoic acid export membrane protein
LIRDAGALLVGTAVGGLLAYVYVAIGTRTYGAEAFAPISVLWTIWALSSAAITFPVQHWVIRTIEADGTEGRVRAALPRILGVAVLVSLVVGVVTWLARSSLFTDPGVFFPLLAALIPLGSVAVGLARGTLAARRRFFAAAAAIAGENLIRVVVATFVVLAGWGREPFAIAIESGFLVVVLWPSALRFHGEPPRDAGISSLAFLGGVAGGTLISQVVLTGGPVMLAALGGSPAAVTGLFSALALFRAPYILGTGLAARVTGSLTRSMLRSPRQPARRLMALTLVGVAVAAPLGALFGAVLGPSLVSLVFGPGISLPADLVAVVAAGSTVALGGLFCTLVLVAAGRGVALTVPWAIAATVGFGWAVLGPGDPLTSVAWGFLVAEMVALIAMMLVGGRRRAELIAGRQVAADEAAPPIAG